MPVLDSTVGGAAANSYASLAQAQEYIDTLVPESLGDVWNDAGEAGQSNALIMATRLLDVWFQWVGDVATTGQALLWPRDGVIGPNGYEVASDEIPLRIIQATAELARQLLAGDRTADSEVDTQGLRRLKAGPVELEFAANVSSKPIPDAVLALAGFFGQRAGASASVRVYRG